MRREVPGDVNLFLEEAQIEAPRIDVAEVTKIPGLNNFNNLTHGRRIEKCVVNHQDQTLAFGDIDQFFTFGGSRGHRLLNKCMFTGVQAGLGQGMVILDRSRNNHCVQSRTVKELLMIRQALDLRI